MTDKALLSQLIIKAKAGDEAAFGELYSEFSRVAYATAKGMLRDEDAAMDIVQETAMAVYRNLQRIDEKGNFFGWVKTIAQNLCKNHLRQKKEVLFAPLGGEDGSFDEALLDIADESETADPAAAAESEAVRQLV
ncbi:MAG: sigma-70 family RNA polymerase sigma factor, partial [Oscillospiraceae bacterium]|nr:sigma-70 family RNA polymerase sigma factor [Oscillospiraceae bacterium]